MKKSLGLVALLVWLLGQAGLSVSQSEAGEAADRVLATGRLVVATDPAWPPFSYEDQNGVWSGFDVDVANEVARRIGATAVFTSPPWAEQVAGHWAGKWDVCICSMTPTAERALNLDFPVVYYWSPVSLAVSADNTYVRRPADLSGKRFGILVPSTYETYLTGKPLEGTGIEASSHPIKTPQIVAFDTDAQVFEALTGERAVDATLNYLPVLLSEIKQGRALRIIGTPLFFVANGVAIDKGDPEFSTLVRDTVEGMHADGTLSGLSIKWFEFDLTKLR